MPNTPTNKDSKLQDPNKTSQQRDQDAKRPGAESEDKRTSSSTSSDKR